MRFKDSQGNDHIGSAVRFSREPAQINTKLPAIGAETAKIIAELDLTEADHKAILSELD
jgi:crotonobetainyl-CoA:carnitine CoA-transferase CaiB-like acyl-CoA transferase